MIDDENKTPPEDEADPTPEDDFDSETKSQRALRI